MNTQNSENKDPLKIRQYAIYSVILWSLVILVLLSWDLQKFEKEKLNRAYTYTKIGFDKDVLYRRWAAEHGGMYVPVTENTPPNKNLKHVKNRDIFIDSIPYTLVNPAYMTRQLHELQETESDVKGHITSLKVIRPENKADVWETKALQLFEKGTKEYYEIDTINGIDYFRYMKPFFVEQSCLKCHGDQDYKLNDIRGGISVSYPMEQINRLSIGESRNHIFQYLLIWALGIVILWLSFWSLKKSDNKRLLAEDNLMLLNHKLEEKVEIRSKELLKAELKWESIFKAIASPAQLIDSNHTIKYVNDATLALLNCKKEDIVGKNSCDIFHFSDDHAKNCPLDKIKTSQKSFTEEIVLKALNKSFIVSYTPVMDSEGNIDSIIHIMTDISTQKATEKLLKESQKKLDAIFDTIPFAINLVDNKGIITYCNQSLLALHGYTAKEELIGQSSSLLFPDFELEHAQQDIAKILKEGTTHALSYTLKRKDGSTFPAEISSSIYIDETTQQKFIVSVAVEITERKNIENELENYRLNLEELVQNRTIEIEEKTKKLERINKLFVGRELRMVELKKELKKLKGGIED